MLWLSQVKWRNSVVQGVFYGWKIVAALFVVMAFSSGLGFYNHSILLQALASDGLFSVEQASFAVSVFFIVSGLAGLLMAPLLDRLDIRWIMIFGTLLAALGLQRMGSVQTVMELYLVYTLFGFGFSATSLLPTTTLLARWFVVHRARALSIASTGLSMGGILITPASAVLIQEVGLTEASNWLAALYVIGVIPISIWVLRPSPASMRLMPDGANWTGHQPETEGVGFKAAVRDVFFWGLNLTYIFVMVAQVGGISHQYGLIAERLPLHLAPVAIAVMPAFSILGRLAGGFVLQYFPILMFTLCMMLLQAIALLILALSYQMIWVFIALAVLGIAVGNLLMLQPLIVAERYGTRDYSRLFSWANLFTVIGVAIGPGLLGWFYSLSLSYEIPYLLAASSGFMAVGLYLGSIYLGNTGLALRAN